MSFEDELRGLRKHVSHTASAAAAIEAGMAHMSTSRARLCASEGCTEELPPASISPGKWCDISEDEWIKISGTQKGIVESFWKAKRKVWQVEYPAQYVGDPVVPGLLQIQHESPTDRECARRLAEQLSAGGTDGDFEREAIRRRVEAELATIDRAHLDLESVYNLGPGFSMTEADSDGFVDDLRKRRTKGAKR